MRNLKITAVVIAALGAGILLRHWVAEPEYLLADETTYTYTLMRDRIRIVCNNEEVAKQIIDFGMEGGHIEYSYSTRNFDDMQGGYPEWIIYIPADIAWHLKQMYE